MSANKKSATKATKPPPKSAKPGAAVSNQKEAEKYKLVAVHQTEARSKAGSYHIAFHVITALAKSKTFVRYNAEDVSPFLPFKEGDIVSFPEATAESPFRYKFNSRPIRHTDVDDFWFPDEPLATSLQSLEEQTASMLHCYFRFEGTLEQVGGDIGSPWMSIKDEETSCWLYDPASVLRKSLGFVTIESAVVRKTDSFIFISVPPELNNNSKKLSEVCEAVCSYIKKPKFELTPSQQVEFCAFVANNPSMLEDFASGDEIDKEAIKRWIAQRKEAMERKRQRECGIEEEENDSE